MSEKLNLKVDGLVIGKRRDGKHYYNEHAKRRLFAVCARSGASVSAVAMANGINPNVLRRWLGIERSRGNEVVPGEPITELLPVVISEDDNEQAPADGMNGSSDTKDTVRHPVELVIEFAHGTLRFTDRVDAPLLKLIADTLSD